MASLRQTLGLDELSVGTNAAGNPTLQAGRYVAKGVYLGAQQATGSNGTQATVQVDLTKRLKLVTTAGTPTATATGAAPTGQAASVGLTYQFQDRPFMRFHELPQRTRGGPPTLPLQVATGLAADARWNETARAAAELPLPQAEGETLFPVRSAATASLLTVTWGARRCGRYIQFGEMP